MAFSIIERPVGTEPYFESCLEVHSMSDDRSNTHSGTPRKTKVGRLLEQYDFDDFGAELERRWTGEAGERESLRTLADAFNKRILEEKMVRAGMKPLDGEVSNIYRLLTDEDISSGTKVETEARFRQHDIDIDELQKDFVTYQAIRTYLKDVRDASYSDEDTDSVATARSSFDKLIGRTTAVVREKFQQLSDAGHVDLGSFQVQTTVNVYCEDCGRQYEARELLKRGGCECAPTEKE